jgi:hypothetical protein
MITPNPAEFKLSDTPRGMRPRCGAPTRSGRPCRAQALMTGLCYIHSNLRQPLPPEARARISETQKRRSPESRYPSEETRRKISAGRRRFEAAKGGDAYG